MLLFRTIVLLSIGAALSSLMGLLTAQFFFNTKEGKIRNEVLYAFLFIIIPRFIYIQSWIFFGDYLYNFLNLHFGLDLDFTGPAAWLTVFSFSNLPLNLGFSLLGFSMIPDWLADLCTMEGGSFAIFRKIYLRSLLPYVFTGFLLSFIIGLYDFSIASVFGMNTFGLELLSRYSTGTSLWAMFRLCLPALLLTLGIIALICPFFKHVFSTVNKAYTNPFENSVPLKIFAILGAILLFLYMAVPLLSLLWKALDATDIFSIIGNSFSELRTSFILSLSAAFFITLFGLLVAVVMKRPYQRFLSGVSLFLFTMPAALLALVSIRLMNRPVLGVIYDSIGMPILVLFLRYQFIGIIGEKIAVNSLDKELFFIADLDGVTGIHRLRLFSGAFKKETCAIFLLAFVLCTGDTTVPILVAPGGVQTISVKIYNYLHYGASDVIAVLCLFMLTLCVAIIVLLQGLLQRREQA